MVGTPGHQSTTKGMKPAEMAPQDEFLSMKALLSRDSTFTSGSPDISFKTKSLHSAPLCKKNTRSSTMTSQRRITQGTAGRISCWFESLSRDNGTLISHVQQSTFWIPVCFPNPSRLFEEKRDCSKGNFCHSSLQPATLQRSLNKICLCVEHIQMLRRLKTARTHNECSCESFKRFKES